MVQTQRAIGLTLYSTATSREALAYTVFSGLQPSSTLSGAGSTAAGRRAGSYTV